MSKSVPASVFYSKRITRGQAKHENESAAIRDNITTKGSKTKTDDVVSLNSDKNERQLRSGVKKTSEKITAPATSVPTSPLRNTQRILRTRKKVNFVQTPQTSSKSTANSSPQTDSNKKCRSRKIPTSSGTHITETPIKRRSSGRKIKTPQPEKNPVYRHAIEESVAVKDTSVVDEYEFQVETPDGTIKKKKKRQQKPKSKVKTLWGMTVKSEAKKLKPSKKAVIQEPENVKPVDKVIQPKILSKDLPIKKTCIPLQERTGNTIVPKVRGGILETCVEDNLPLSELKKNAEQNLHKENGNISKSRIKQRSEEQKENTPAINKINSNIPATKLSTPLKKKTTPVQSNSTPIHCPFQSPLSVSNMQFMLSPIQADGSSTPQFELEKAIHASTPAYLNRFDSPENPSGTNALLEDEHSPHNCQPARQPLPLSTPLTINSSSHSAEKNTSLHEPSNISEKQLSSNSVSDHDSCGSLDNDLLDTSNIFKDIPTNAKFSVPARLQGRVVPGSLGSNRLTSLARCSSAQVGPPKLSSWRPGQLPTIPQDKAVSESSVVEPCTEPTVDNCFGFDDHTNEDCGYFNKPVRPVVFRKPCLQPKSTDSLPIEKINEMLLSSLPKVKNQQKKSDSLIFCEDATVKDNSEPKSTSLLTLRNFEDNTFSQPGMPLFEDLEKEDTYKSPFIQPPRRSYAGLRPLKRITFREDLETEDGEEPKPEKPSKRTKTAYKRKKMVQTTLLDKWAKDISSHFAEVEEIELITE